MNSSLKNLLEPKSIAVVGASRDPKKLGNIVLRNIVENGFKGKVYPVNPQASQINNLPCFPSVLDLPETPDVALISLPSSLVLEILPQLNQKKIKNAVVYSAGFKESGNSGKELENKLLNESKKYAINLLGPNCLGFVNNEISLNATFSKVSEKIGPLRFIAQSGAIASALFDWFAQNNIGFSQFVTLGNKTILTENDFLEYYLEEQNKNNVYHPIALYLESINYGKKFLELTSAFSQKAPIFILKPGKSPAAQKAMQSHTGAIAGEDAVLDQALKQAGVIRCQTLQEFFNLSQSFSWYRPLAGKNIAIISNAGGPAVISADKIAETQLNLYQYNEETKQELARFLPRSASFLNPIDVLGDALAEQIGKAVETVARIPETNAVLVILTPQIMTEIEKTARLISMLSKKYKTPIFCSFMGGGKIEEGRKILIENQIPSFAYPEEAINTISQMYKIPNPNIQKRKVRKTQHLIEKSQIIPISNKISDRNTNLPKLDSNANDLFVCSGITTPAALFTNSVEEAKVFAEKNGYPVVLKISAPGLLHKTEVGGIIKDINNSDDIQKAWQKIQENISFLPSEQKNDARVQVQQQISGGFELIIGVKTDLTFGKVLLFSAGGIYTELLAEKNLLILPAKREQILALINNSKVKPILAGYRGQKPYALDKLVSLMEKLCQIALDERIKELEINPVIITQTEAFAIDAKIILK